MFWIHVGNSVSHKTGKTFKLLEKDIIFGLLLWHPGPAGFVLGAISNLYKEIVKLQT